MDNNYRIAGTSIMAWATITLIAFVLLIVSSFSRGNDNYDIARGTQAIIEQPALLAAGYIVFAWSGATLVFVVVAFRNLFPADSQTYLVNAGAAFGLIGGTLFLLYGLVGGMGFLDLSYVQSVRGADYIGDVYLPFAVMTNRTLAAAIAVSGLWFVLVNWHFLRSGDFPRLLAYLGLGAGAIAMTGLVMPAGDFGAFSLLLLGVPWGILIGFQLLRRPTLVSSESLP
jgi:hypothetical protein